MWSDHQFKISLVGVNTVQLHFSGRFVSLSDTETAYLVDN